MSPLPRQGWLFLIEFLKWYFSKYWQVRTRPVFAQTITYDKKARKSIYKFEDLVLVIFHKRKLDHSKSGYIYSMSLVAWRPNMIQV